MTTIIMLFIITKCKSTSFKLIYVQCTIIIIITKSGWTKEMYKQQKSQWL